MTVRVLVVEDSPTVREHLVAVLRHSQDSASHASPDFEVIGQAPNGQLGFELCRELRPDVVTLDMMLPIMSGLEATEQIMAYCPTPILIVSSSTNRGEVFKTYDALAAGAVDVIEKPLGDESDAAWATKFRSTVKLVSRIRVITHPRARLNAMAPLRPLSASPVPSLPAENFRLIAIGTSTGGPGAIVELLRHLNCALPVLLVIHMNEPFAAGFVEWIAERTGRATLFARDGQALAELGNHVIVAPPDHHLVVREERLYLNQEAEHHFCRPSVDVLFASLAQGDGRGVIACLLTGMGRDGAQGLLAIRRAGGMTIAQDEASSVVFGMPREAALIGAAKHVLALQDIGPLLTRLAGSALPQANERERHKP